jgi:hypothetical protein
MIYTRKETVSALTKVRMYAQFRRQYTLAHVMLLLRLTKEYKNEQKL